jgi:hypothetical protein
MLPPQIVRKKSLVLPIAAWLNKGLRYCVWQNAVDRLVTEAARSTEIAGAYPTLEVRS